MAEDMDLGVLAESFADMLGNEWPREKAIARARAGAGTYEPGLWQAMAELGWTALTVPEAHGGLGLGLDAAVVLHRALGAAVAPVPMLGSTLAAELLASGGSEAQQAALLPGIADGSLRIGVAVGEDAPVRIEAERASGMVRDVLDAPAATHVMVRAVRAGEAGWLILAADGLGVAVDLVDVSRSLGDLALDRVACHGDAFIAGGEAAVTRAAMLAIAADAQGCGEAVLAATIEYMKGREQFGVPIASFQALKHRVADHQTALVASSFLLEHAARLAADDPQAMLYALAAKQQATRVAAEVARDCVQLHGGVGFTAEYVPHLYLKRAKLNECFWGTRATVLDRLADLLEAA